MNKREDNEEENDSDFIEEEKEAIRLQKLRLEKIKKAKLLNEEEESEEEENKKTNKKLNNKDNNKKNEIKNEISIKPIEIDNKKINENIDLLKNCLEEYKMVDDEIKILSDNKKTKVPKTISYLKEYKKINILYSANILFNILATLNNKMTGHHPSIKYSAMFNYLLSKNSEKNEQIQNNIEKILLFLEKNDKNNKNEENEEEDDINEDDGDEEGEEIDDDNLDEENEEMEDVMGEEEEEEEIEDKKKKGKKENKKEDNKNIYDKLIGDPIKKPSFLNKKKKRKKSDKEIIDINNNESFDKEDNKNDDEDESEDSFINEQYKSFNKLKKEKELLDIKNKENEKKEIDMKNNFAIRKANKEVLTARGIYRKRKRYQGNAKLMNREKFYKKEKERRRNVKEYVGKPDVYTGEATGIRRDLIRSTKIH
jgi:hypothetical protein